ncbi:lytic transglycosylase domain-containing protein [Sphingomonas sp.]|uniref:lytic transglycosylase domain-containing protein n=1 Tax=Sphingomonas sp. TaxID=28214 RepID=UPI002D803B94|nr:lytic transglycosylase domain-containing protein [Sphingomonas sp.]HEU0044693.1 lytic transglycosylase domain-containing protein [Sphingomonas sp.]
MLAPVWKISFIAAALASVGASGVQDFASQPRLPAPADTSIASALAEWRTLSDTSRMPFDSYANFLLARRGWPNEAAIRRAAEAQAGVAAPFNVVRLFRSVAPLTAGGRVAYARALLATGSTAEALVAARAAWRGGALSAQDEALLLSAFGAQLTTADHEARVDALLWGGRAAAARPGLPYVSAGRRAIDTARIAFRTNAPEASELSASTAALYGNDAGYVADRATWLRANNAAPSARTWLAQPRRLATPPGNAEEYMEVLLTHARGAAADGQWQTAYDIARQIGDVFPAGVDVATRSYGERDDYTSLAWLAATAAFRQLNRPADAMTLFERYANGTPTPSTRSKGLYWAARAAERAGLTAEAARLWAAAASHREAYYGQLANEQLGRSLSAPAPVPARMVDPLVKAAFGSREVVRAARFLGNVGMYEEQTAFVRQIALDAKSEPDHLLAADLARDLQRPDLAVMIGRSALTNGHLALASVGYPTLPVPMGYEGDWTFIHAIGRQESQFNRAAISSAGARGLLQLMPGTAREQAGKMGISYQPSELLTDPSLSMKLGSGYFRRVHAIYGSYPMALAAYNAGPGNVNKWLRANGDPRAGGISMVDWVEAIPIQETRNYVQRVLENAVVYDLMRPDRAVSRGPNHLSWYLGRRPG